MALYLLFFVFLLFSSCAADSTADDKQALLRFLSAVHRPGRVQWNASSPTPCSWVGVVCDPVSSRVVQLRLPGVGLVGSIPPSTIGRLTQLRVISLRSNLLSGPLPDDFANLKHLRSLYLQHNLVSGEFPTLIPSLSRLTRLDLSFNRFSSRVPFAINNLTHLTGLFLQNNSFSGAIPAIDIPGLTSLNLSNNQFNGSVPRPLQRFPAEAFTGNVDLCGPPLPALCNPFFPSPPAPSPSSPQLQESHRRRLSRAAIIVIAILCALLLLLLLLALLLLCLRKRRQRTAGTAKPPTRVVEAVGGPSSSKDEFLSSGQEAERNKLVFFNGGGYSFDLEDLLRASAEVLGKGSVGTSYKAVLEEGTTVVVKRLKDVAVGKREFEAQMEVVGRIQHTNLVPIRAYYYSKDEKLLVLDYMQAGSLSSLLHGSRGSGRTPLDWDNRMKIAVHSARGLTHLHETARTVHGNIKASNILLRPNLDACFSDFGLSPLFSNSTTPTARVAGYRAPEVIETRKVTYKSDVYSFGVLLLELLTGKSPNQASLNDEGIDLPRWVQSVVREEWTAEVFDVELMRYQNIEEEMVQLLQIAMACVATMPEQRPQIRDVLRMIEDINRADTDDGQRQSSDDKSKGSGGRTPPEVRTPPAGATP